MMDAFAVALRAGADESVTMRTTELGPAAVGVPVIWPPATDQQVPRVDRSR